MTEPVVAAVVVDRGRKVRGTWTVEEDDALRAAVKKHGAKTWKKIAKKVPGRTDVQCLHRWQKVLDPDLVKGPWTPEEDRKVIELVKKHGPRKWSAIAAHLPGRIGKQARERWANHLDPNVRKGAWEPWEDEKIIELQAKFGNSWAKISQHLKGRTDNAIKNRFNSTISRRMRQDGKVLLSPTICPRAHTQPTTRRKRAAPRKRARTGTTAAGGPTKKKRAVKPKKAIPITKTETSTASTTTSTEGPAPVQVLMPDRRPRRNTLNDDGDYVPPTGDTPSTPPRSPGSQSQYIAYGHEVYNQNLYSPTSYHEQNSELFLTTRESGDISNFDSFQSPKPTHFRPQLFSPSPGGAFTPPTNRSSTPAILNRNAGFSFSPPQNFSFAPFFSPDPIPRTFSGIFSDSPARTPNSFNVPVRRQLNLDSPVAEAPMSPYYQSLRQRRAKSVTPTARRQLNLGTVDRDAAATLATTLPNSPPPSPNMKMFFRSSERSAQLNRINAKVNGSIDGPSLSHTQIDGDVSVSTGSVTKELEDDDAATDKGTMFLQLLSQSRKDDKGLVTTAETYIRSPQATKKRKVLTRNVNNFQKENFANHTTATARLGRV